MYSASHDRAIMEQAAEYQAIIAEKNKEIAALKEGIDILLDDLEKRSLVISRMSAELVPPLSRFYEGMG